MSVLSLFACLLVTGCTLDPSILAELQDPEPKPWTPPKTKLPPEFVQATEFLLAHGLGDPRGGEYRNVTIRIQNIWGHPVEPAPAKGWLLDKKHVVCWDGLVYEPVTVGDKADLKADVAAAGPKELPGLAKGVRFRFNNSSGSIDTPVGVSLLLIAGHAALAEKVFPLLEGEVKQPYRSLVNSYARSRFERAVTSHMAGDDRLAYSDSVSLQKNRKDFEEKVIADLGPNWEQRMTVYDIEGKKTLPITFLSPLDNLVRDSKRRLEEDKAQSKVDLEAWAKLDQATRIAKLTEAMDEIKARQWGQPGGIDYNTDPIYKAIVAEGEAIVDPLIVVLETDRRLTRSVGFPRDFAAIRYLVSVETTAWRAISDILDGRSIPQFKDRRELREWWSANRGTTPARRAYDVLAQDSANPKEWLSSARLLVESADVKHSSGWVAVPQRKAGEVPAMKGEELRGKVTPSVSDLLAKRAMQMAGSGPVTSSNDQFVLANGMAVALCLARWDANASLPTLVAISKRVPEVLDAMRMGNVAESVLGTFGILIAKRLELGDDKAWADYEPLVGLLQPSSYTSAYQVLMPIWQHPGAPQAKRIAERLFADPTSPWIVNVKPASESYFYILAVLDSPVLMIPAYRDQIQAMLDDKSVAAEAEVRGTGLFIVGPHGSSGTNYSPDKDFPKDGSKVKIRVADRTAETVSRLKGAPPFAVYWPTEKKDKAIAEIKAYFTSIASRVRDVLSIERYLGPEGY